MTDRECGRATRWALLLAGGCAGVLVLAGCVPASPSPDTYEDKAAMTVESALSEVATAQLSVQALDRGRAFRAAVLTQLRYSEDSLDAAARAFTELNPPAVDDRLHDRVDRLLTDAQDLLAQTRVTVTREQIAQYPSLGRKLARLAERLDRLEKQVAS